MDLAEAVDWFKKSADEGFAGAQYALGRMYESGLGVSKNSDEAVKWYQKAADQGLAEAKDSLRKLRG